MKGKPKLKKQFNLDSASRDEVTNRVIKFMVGNKNRHSAKSAEIAKHFDCSVQKASRILNGLVAAGKLRRDYHVENLYWIDPENF